ncbi:MAG: hypothetical protein LW817_06410 [Candidatus Caenarcaniphilales bacterium]|jgi:hypothetical protein|nr:hypothetical protein [Candidatus Caenarcaniphilales bacterium]
MVNTATHIHGPHCNHAHEHKHEHKHEHDHNCATCTHDHDHAQHTNTKSLINKIHEHNGHSCVDPHCEVKAPHGHNLIPLEKFIMELNLSQRTKHFLVNLAYLTPALFSSEILEKIPMPKFIKSWISITAMHGINRGKDKTGRLMLMYAVSGLSNIANSLMPKFLSFIPRMTATTAIAVVEKFAGNGQKELSDLFFNLIKIKTWKELLPSLLNIEAKVQIVSPIVNKIIPKTGLITRVLAQSLATSLAFVGVDEAIRAYAKKSGDDSFIASAVNAICGCCGSSVCTAAIADSAVNNTL